MEPTIQQQVHLTNNKVYVTRTLYERYGSMLFGYIYDVVKDKTLAEQYLISIFNEVPAHTADLTESGSNTWCRLLLLAKRQLAGFNQTLHDCEINVEGSQVVSLRSNKFLDLMNAEQQLVFCGVHYHNKTVTQLAIDLDKSEDSIRKVLKQAFTIIRNGSEYSGIHR